MFKDALIDIAFGLYNLTARPLKPPLVLPSDPIEALNAFFNPVGTYYSPKCSTPRVHPKGTGGAPVRFLYGI